MSSVRDMNVSERAEMEKLTRKMHREASEAVSRAYAEWERRGGVEANPRLRRRIANRLNQCRS